MRAEDFLTPEEIAELRELNQALTSDPSESKVPKAKTEKQIQSERVQDLYKSAQEKLRLKAFNDILDPAARGFATKIRNAAYDRGQLVKLETDPAFLQLILDKVVLYLKKK